MPSGRKKRERDRQKRQEIGMYRQKNDVRKFYEKVKCLTEGLSPKI